MKILITGGHLAPALAIIQHIPKNADIVYVGRKHPFEGDSGLSLEYEIIGKLGIPFVELQTARLQRKFTRYTFSSLLKMPSGVIKASQILKKEKPDIVLGLGGYLSLSIGIAAWLQKIPLLIHEQTFHAGLANKILGKIATKIAISWESSQKYFPKSKTVLVGNPHLVSCPSASIQKLIDQTSSAPRLVITGGSAGSHRINVLIEHILPEILKTYHVIHQTGDARKFGDFERLQEYKKTLPQELQDRYHLMKFIDPSDFDVLYEHAKVVVCRAGINTLTTLILLKTPAVLIPIQAGQKNDQATNAEFIKKIGLGEVVHQDVSPSTLLNTIVMMMDKNDTYRNVEVEKYATQHQHAAQNLIQLLYVVYQVNSEKKS